MIKKYLKENWFRIILMVIVFLTHCLVYWIAPLFISRDPIEMKMITVFDQIPFYSPFIIAYFGCFAWWIVAFVTAKKERVYRIFFVCLIGYLIIAICFVLLPYRMDWSQYPIEGKDIFSQIVLFLRNHLDKPEKLFPSIHVFVSACAYAVIAFDKEKKLWVRAIHLLWLIAVWFSTITLKQHYFVDGLAAIIIVLVFYPIVAATKMDHLLNRLEENIVTRHLEKTK